MLSRFLTLGLAASLLTLAAPAGDALGQASRQRGAQPRTGTQPRGDAESDLNQRHERAKIEAQEATRNGDHRHALELMDGVLRENPRDDLALYIRAGARVELGRGRRDLQLVRSGVADARRALELKGTRSALYYLPYLRGMATLAELENFPEHAEVAVSVADRVLALPDLSTEEQTNLRYQRGLAQSALGKHAEAAADFERAVRLSPRHLGALVAAAEAYNRAGRHDQATSAYDRAVRSFPESAVLHNNRGQYRQSQGDFRGALADFTRAIELDRNLAVSYVNRGYARLQQGDAASAETDASAALRIDPDYAFAYNVRGAARLSQNKTGEALADFEALVRLDPRSAVALADLGFARFFTGNYDGALEAFTQTADLNSQLRFVHPWRLLCLELTGAPESRRRQLAEGLLAPPERRNWTDHLIAYAAGTMDADELLTRVDSQDERVKTDQLCEAHFFIGHRLSKAGESEDAERHFHEALATDSQHLSAYRGARFALAQLGTAATPQRGE